MHWRKSHHPNFERALSLAPIAPVPQRTLLREFPRRGGERALLQTTPFATS
jgi:hypothetical protein